MARGAPAAKNPSRRHRYFSLKSALGTGRAVVVIHPSTRAPPAPARPPRARAASAAMPPPHFRVTYTIAERDEPAARAIVDALCLEQTVELPLELVPPGTWIHEHVVGKCESLRRSAWQPKSKGANTAFETTTTTTQRPPHRPHRQSALTRWEAVVRYHDNTTGGEIPQLLNVLFGNTSIKENVMVTDLALSPSLLSSFFGPRHGVRGLREILGVPRGPMLMTALKPMGSDVEVRSISHWSPYDPVRVVNADP